MNEATGIFRILTSVVTILILSVTIQAERREQVRRTVQTVLVRSIFYWTVRRT